MIVPACLSRDVGRAHVMTFKRSVWWGIAGAACVSIAGWLALTASKSLSDAFTDLFLWLGLNPREEGLWCVLLFFAFTSITGFLVGFGVHFRSRRA